MYPPRLRTHTHTQTHTLPHTDTHPHTHPHTHLCSLAEQVFTGAPCPSPVTVPFYTAAILHLMLSCVAMVCVAMVCVARRLLLTPPDVPPPCAGVLLLVSVLVGVALVGACPAVCSCSPSSRQVDCSSRGLRVLPPGLQHNLHSLNLSHNHLGSLDHQLSPFTHLRFLDLSNNSLARLPSALPRGLWELRAAHNAIRLLHKNDTAYQWNLRLLDLSGNHLERAVFINNTLTSLRSLNLSHNRFWTLPTNLPSGLVTVDLSHNSLVQVLPGSLDRLPGLVHLDLHANRFSRLGGGVFSLLTGLKLLSLGGNPWSCEDPSSMAPLLAWLQQTPARVLGCPCSPRSVCGQARTPRTGGWHYASYTLPPLAASEPSRGDSWPPSHARPTGWWYLSEPIHHTLRAPSSFTLHPQHLSSPPPSSSSPPSLLPHTRHADGLQSSTTPLRTHLLFLTHTPPTPSPSTPPDLPPPPLTPSTTKRTSTLRTRSVRRPNQPLPDGVQSQAPGPLVSCPLQGPLRSPLLLALLVLAVLH